MAYAAQQGNKQFMVVDGRHFPAYDMIIDHMSIFSPDGKRVAYAAATKLPQKTGMSLLPSEPVYKCFLVVDRAVLAAL